MLPPGGVASRALAIRLSMICSRCPGVVVATTCSGMRAVRLMDRSAASGAQASMRPPTTWAMRVGARAEEHFPTAGDREQAVEEPGEPGQLGKRVGDVCGDGRFGVVLEQFQT